MENETPTEQSESRNVTAVHRTHIHLRCPLPVVSDLTPGIDVACLAVTLSGEGKDLDKTSYSYSLHGNRRALMGRHPTRQVCETEISASETDRVNNQWLQYP